MPHDDTHHSPSGFPPRDYWLSLLPMLPLLLAIVLLAPLIEPGAQLKFLREGLTFIDEPLRSYVHLGDMLSYHALAAFHSLLCLGVVATFTLWIFRLPGPRRQGALIFLAVVLALIVALGLYLKAAANEVILVQLGYKAVCQLLDAAALPTQLVPAGQCFSAGISHLTWLAWVPTFSGIGAVAFAGAFAYGSMRGLPPRGSADDETVWRAALDARVQALQKAVYLLSAVLVSSTVTITLFAHLPVGLLPAGSGSLAAAVSKYATGLSTFWGALFSITLVATFAMPALRLLGAAYGRESKARDSDDLRDWLQEHVFQSLRRQLATVFSLLAPLLVGPLSSLLASVSGI
jgi:hypothetical protein